MTFDRTTHRRRFVTAAQSLQHLTSEAKLMASAKHRSRRIPEGLSAKTYQQTPLDEIADVPRNGSDRRS